MKITHPAVNMPGNDGDITVKPAGNTLMGGTSKKPDKGETTKDSGKKSPSKAVEDDDYEDGDFATPKRDHTGDDDQPL